MKLKLIIILILFSLFLAESSKFKIKKTQQKITIEIIEPYYEIQKSNIYEINYYDWLDRKTTFTGFYIQNGVLFFWICINKKNIKLLFWTCDNKYVFRDDIEIIMIQKANFIECCFSENNILIKLRIYKDY
jgi:hypothetical protein